MMRVFRRVLWILSTGIAMRAPVPRTAVGLPEIRPSRLLQALQLAFRVGQAGLGELVIDGAPAAFEDAEHVRGFHRFPGRQGVERGQDAGFLGDLRIVSRGRRTLEVARYRRCRSYDSPRM